MLGIILGGGAGSRLYPLTKKRAKPAVPLGANYRLIDIPVSNCINSGVNKIYCLTQFNSASLNRHLSAAYVSGRWRRLRRCRPHLSPLLLHAAWLALPLLCHRLGICWRVRSPQPVRTWPQTPPLPLPGGRTRTWAATTRAALSRCWRPARPPPPRSGSRQGWEGGACRSM